ncbi:MAG: LysR family transcriptional regulator [Nocardioidaceae bacterium]
MIDLRRLQVLRAVHQHGTVTAAGHALHLTPSAVSQQLRALSRELGISLLEQQGRRVHLTPAAHTLLRHAHILAGQWEQAQAELYAHADEIAGELGLCGFPTGVAELLAPAAARLQDEHPHLVVHVAEVETADAFDLLLSGDTDLAVVQASDCPPRGDARFDQLPLLDEPMDLLVPAGHPFAACRAVALADAADQSWIVGVAGTSYHQHTLVACAAAGFTPAIAHHAKEWISISALVAQGLGVALIPRLGDVPPAHAAVRVPLCGEPAPFRRMLTCVRHGSREQPAITRALHILGDIASDLQQRVS